MSTETDDLKKLWNEAVRSTLLEIEKYDGVVPDKQVMKYMVDSVWDKISYKIKTTKLK